MLPVKFDSHVPLVGGHSPSQDQVMGSSVVSRGSTLPQIFPSMITSEAATNKKGEAAHPVATLIPDSCHLVVTCWRPKHICKLWK